MSKSLLTVFSAWVIVHGRKYSYNLKLAQIYENVSSKFCKFLASFLTRMQDTQIYSHCKSCLLHDSYRFNIYVFFQIVRKIFGGGHDFSNYKQRVVRKNTQELKGAIVFHTRQVPNCPAPPP